MLIPMKAIVKVATFVAFVTCVQSISIPRDTPDTYQSSTYGNIQQSIFGRDPAAVPTSPRQAGANWWLENIKKQGIAAFNVKPGPLEYKVFRNIKDFGAKGDGTTDDTEAINEAIRSGNRCGKGCDSSTITPALVYFPPGVYRISKPIVAMYYSQLVGNPYDRAVIKGLPNFEGMALIDSDPYEEGGVNWYTNQNNFFRAIRNLVIDTTDQPLESGTGLHWQVAQATSLLNIKFIMSQADGNKHQGIFMDNGSGGHMSDLEFVGGLFGAWMGNQQFISRNMKFTNCQTAIYVNWNWQWTFKSLDINNCGIALDISGKEDNGALKVGSVIMLDSVISNTKIGLKTSRVGKFDPPNAQSAVLDNVKLINVGQAVASDSGETILAGGSLTIDLWGQGQTYNGAGDIETVQGPMKRNFPKPAALLSTNGKILERARPQYINYKAEDFISVRDHGAKGDGKTDDTEALRAIFLKFGGNSRKIIYFDHGVYVVSDTVQIPVGSKLLGEVWSVIMADGKVFQDPTNPKAVFRVGNPGDQGIVEMSEFIFQTRGPQPGAILLQWNSRDASGIKGSNALFDVHFRVGGSAGTELETHQCVKKPDHDNSTPDPKCIGSFLHLHITKRASLYIENCWAWTSDHALDFPFTQITIYNGRGILSESKDGPVWFYAAAAEHNVLYQYQIMNSQNVFMAMIQSETPYFQPNPTADKPFPSLAKWNDPDYSKCTTDDCKKSWALRILNSDKVLIYGAGLYSFFQNYNQACVDTKNCQKKIVDIQKSPNVAIFQLNTIASESMVDIDNKEIAKAVDNQGNFCQNVMMLTGGK